MKPVASDIVEQKECVAQASHRVRFASVRQAMPDQRQCSGRTGSAQSKLTCPVVKVIL
jgi:hypothetical protein